MSALLVESRPALPLFARGIRTLLKHLGRAIDTIVSARAARQVPEWQMRQVQHEIDRPLSRRPGRQD